MRDPQHCRLIINHFDKFGRYADTGRGEMSVREIEVWRGEGDAPEVTILVDQQTHGAEEGSVVWDCSLVLIDYLTKKSKLLAASQAPKQQHHPASVFSDCWVLDVGSGTGVMGLAAHAMGAAHVILTDRPSQVNLLEANVDRNRTALQLPGTMEVLVDALLIDIIVDIIMDYLWTPSLSPLANTPHTLYTLLHPLVNALVNTIFALSIHTHTLSLIQGGSSYMGG